MEFSLKKYNKIGIMGGTFDPIHNGHLYISELVMDKLKLDIVLFVPTGIMPHKNAANVTDKRHRYAMTILATNFNKKFTVSDIEITNDKTSYTVDTISKIKSRCSESAQLYFITGVDAVSELDTWKSPEKIGELCTIVAVTRPNFTSDEYSKKLKKISKKFNATIELVTGFGLEISSTNVREAILNNSSIKYLVPEEVCNYIEKNSLYIDDYSDKLISKIEADAKEELSSKRFIHIMGVATTCEKLALFYGCSPKLAYICGLLHDISKEYSKSKKKDFCKNNNIYLDELMSENIDLAHGIISAEIGKKQYSIENEDVYNAVMNHVTGRANMSMLEKIMFLADITEPSRDFKGVEELRALTYQDIDAALIKAIKIKIEFTKKRGDTVHPQSIVALNYLERYAKNGN